MPVGLQRSHISSRSQILEKEAFGDGKQTVLCIGFIDQYIGLYNGDVVSTIGGVVDDQVERLYGFAAQVNQIGHILRFLVKRIDRVADGFVGSQGVEREHATRVGGDGHEITRITSLRHLQGYTLPNYRRFALRAILQLAINAASGRQWMGGGGEGEGEESYDDQENRYENGVADGSTPDANRAGDRVADGPTTPFPVGKGLMGGVCC